MSNEKAFVLVFAGISMIRGFAAGLGDLLDGRNPALIVYAFLTMVWAG